MSPKVLIKQPNGLYCQYSTIVDAIVCYNMTPKDVVQEYTDDAVDRAQRNAKENMEFADEWENKSTVGKHVYNWKDNVRHYAMSAAKEYPDQLEAIKAAETEVTNDNPGL